MKKTMFSSFLGAAALLAGCGDDPPKAPEGSDHPLYKEMCGAIAAAASCETEEACLSALDEFGSKQRGLWNTDGSPLDKSQLPAAWRDITQDQVMEARSKSGQIVMLGECAPSKILLDPDKMAPCQRRGLQPFKELYKCQ